VTVETSFNSQIVKIKRRIVVQAIHRVLLNASLIFLAINIFYFILSLAGIINYRITEIRYVLPMAISIAAAVCIGYATRSNLLNILIDIDRRLKLQDRVSTAYEYIKLKKKTDFAELLINDAAIKLGQISKQQLVPAQFSVLHLLVIILLLINIFLYSGVFFTPGFKSIHRDLEKLDTADQLLKNYMIKRIKKKNVQQSTTRSGHAEKLAQISRKLGDSSKPFEQRLAALDSFLEEVEGEQTRLAQELGARLDSADIKKIPIPKTPDLRNLSSSQLEQLKGLLSRTLNNRLPDSIDQNIESLQELDSIENLLSRIIDDLKDGRAKKDDSIQSAGVEGGQMPQSTATSENQPAEPDTPYPNGKFSDPNPNTGDRADHKGFEKWQRKGDNRPHGMEPADGDSDAAGNAKSNEGNQSSHELDKTQSAATQDKLATSAAKTYLIHIRALTDTGEARVKEEEIFRTYRKEVENILQKEDIPVNYREYIKNYFISIGMNTKENAHESK
jgi:hypothetical protein